MKFCDFFNYCRKRKSGFTLIEVLAIIVVLAIITVITVPAVLTVMDNAKKETAKASALGFKDAINRFYYREMIADNDIDFSGNFDILDGVLKSTVNSSDEFIISVDGEKPVSGNVDIDKGDIVSGCMQINVFAVVFDDGEISKIEKNDCERAVE